jgi:hypothetical protein
MSILTGPLRCFGRGPDFLKEPIAIEVKRRRKEGANLYLHASRILKDVATSLRKNDGAAGFSRVW